MAIAHAEQRGTMVYIFDEKGRPLGNLPGELVNFTSTTFSVKRSKNVYIFNEKLRPLKTIYNG